jgi:hypothetical protein
MRRALAVPFRFRRSIRIAPGIRLNISRRGGLSISIGGRGARVSIGHGYTRAMVSTPAIGLSYTATTHRRSASIVTVVIWGARLLVAAIVWALLFLWTAGWL